MPRSLLLLCYSNNKTHIFLFFLASFLLVSSFYNFNNITQYYKFSNQQYKVFAQTAVSDISTNDFPTYENSTIGIRLQYPPSFEIIEFGQSVAFHTPLEADEQVFSEQVGIITGDDIFPTTADDVSANTTINDYLAEQFNNFMNAFANYSLVEEPTDITINGNPAKKAIFTTTLPDGKQQRTMEIWTMDQSSGKLYQIEVSVNEGKYSEFPPAHIQNMIDSIQFLSTLSAEDNTQFNGTQSDSLVTQTSGGLELAGAYDDSVYGTSIGFPAYWQVDDIDQNPSDDVRNIVFFYPPGTDAFVEFSTVETQFPGTTDEYLDGVIGNFRNTFQDFNLLESSTTNINFAGHSGYKFISTYQHNGTNYQRMETGAIIDGRPFFVVYDAEEQKYSNYIPLVDLMVESLQIPRLSQGSTEEQAEEVLRQAQPGNITFGENATLSESNITDMSVLTNQNQTAIPSPSFINYQNTTYGIQIQYPSNWEKQEHVGDVIFLSPLENNMDTFREGLVIIIQSVPPEDISLNNFVNNTLNSLMQATPDFQLINSYQTNLANSIPAHRVEYTWINAQNNIETKTMEVYAIANGKSYIISYGAPLEKYNLYLPTVQSMISSLIL